MPKSASLKPFDHYLVHPGKKVNLGKLPTAQAKHIPDRPAAEAQTLQAAQRIGELQDILYAEGRRSLLFIFQGLDASGKDGAIRKVFDAVNPAGLHITSFKSPSPEELRHDFLWRIHQKAPALGTLAVFNRSHYEDVLIVRVHQDRFLSDHLRNDKNLWPRRFHQIGSFERMLVDSSTTILKFFLHISREEQAERFRARQQDPKKHWKLAAGDFDERKFWDDYHAAYEQMLPNTSTDFAPWYIIPADRKWTRNYLISHIIAAKMESLGLHYPELTDQTLVQRRFK